MFEKSRRGLPDVGGNGHISIYLAIARPYGAVHDWATEALRGTKLHHYDIVCLVFYNKL